MGAALKELFDIGPVTFGSVTFKDFFEQFIIARKRMNKIQPKMFHPTQQVAGTGEPFGIPAEKLVMEIIEA